MQPPGDDRFCGLDILDVGVPPHDQLFLNTLRLLVEPGLAPPREAVDQVVRIRCVKVERVPDPLLGNQPHQPTALFLEGRTRQTEPGQLRSNGPSCVDDGRSMSRVERSEHWCYEAARWHVARSLTRKVRQSIDGRVGVENLLVAPGPRHALEQTRDPRSMALHPVETGVPERCVEVHHADRLDDRARDVGRNIGTAERSCQLGASTCPDWHSSQSGQGRSDDGPRRVCRVTFLFGHGDPRQLARAQERTSHAAVSPSTWWARRARVGQAMLQRPEERLPRPSGLW